MLDAIAKQQGCDLSGERLIRTFMWRRLQPLTAHLRMMWQFTGDNDSDRYSTMNMEKE
jgi:hypothetical protein